MVGSVQRLKQIAGAVGIGATCAFSGCADGVELNWKVFDLLGVSPAALEASR